MAQLIQCPSCGKSLRIPDGVADPWLSCPHCLAQLPNPQAAGIQTAPSPSSARTTCPHCGEPVESGWRYCPLCQEDLRRPGAPRLSAGPDVDVRRDQRGTSVFLVILAIIGGLGFAYSALVGVALLNDGTAWPLAIFVAVVLGIGAFSAVRVYNKPQPPTGARGVGRVVVLTLVRLGCLFGVVVLVGVAAFILLLVVCLVNAPRFH